MKKIKFSKAINEAMHYCMKKDKKVLCFGLGVTDPKRIFGSTEGLLEKFGKNRVFDVPTSENAITGIGIGLSLNKFKPVMVHQRLDFFLLAMDQLVNSAAKYYYMFGKRISVPITIRLIIGRGWGQGPTHSQCLHSWFAHIPGLKVVMPANANDAKNLLISSINDPNPVVFIEHRWLYDNETKYENKISKLGRAEVVKKGKDVTIVAMSILVLEAIQASKILKKYFNISTEVINLKTIAPLDWNLLFRSVKKTKNLIVADLGFSNNSFANEVIYRCENKVKFKNKSIKIAMPDYSVPTSISLTEDFYPNSITIIKKILKMFNIKFEEKFLKKFKEELSLDKNHHDVPGSWFKGPF